MKLRRFLLSIFANSAIKGRAGIAERFSHENSAIKGQFFCKNKKTRGRSKSRHNLKSFFCSFRSFTIDSKELKYTVLKYVKFLFTKHSRKKFRKVDFRNFILKYDVIHDALRVISDKNFQNYDISAIWPHHLPTPPVRFIGGGR